MLSNFLTKNLQLKVFISLIKRHFVKKILGNNSRFDSYFLFQWFTNSVVFEYIIEYKLLKNSEGKQILNAQEAINQIFAKKCPQKFKRSHPSCELFLIGVGFNPFDDQHIISEILIKKYKGNGLPIDKQESWEEIKI